MCHMNTSIFYCCYYVEKREKKESTTNDKSAKENRTKKNKGNVNCNARCTTVHATCNGYFIIALFLLLFIRTNVMITHFMNINKKKIFYKMQQKNILEMAWLATF